MGDDHPVPLRREFVGVAGKRIQAVRQVKLLRVVGRPIGKIGIDQTMSMANSKSLLKTSLPLPSVTLLLHVTPYRFRPIL
jgi:hypothetical protein